MSSDESNTLFDCSIKEIEETSSLQKTLQDALNKDSNYINDLFLLCDELKQKYSSQIFSDFNETCIKSDVLVNNICRLSSRFLILREFLQLAKDDCLPVQLLCAFQKSELLNFPIYLAVQPDFVSKLAEVLADLIFVEDSVHLNFVSTLISPTFISVMLPNPILGCPSEKLHTILQTSILNKLLSNSNKTSTDFIRHLTKERVPSKSFLVFVKQMLRRILSHKSDLETPPTFIDAVKNIGCWTYNKTPKPISHFIQQLLECLAVDEVLKIIDSFLNEVDSYNWKWLLIVVSTLLVTVKTSAEFLKKSLENWLKEAVSKKIKHRLTAVMIIFRQCFTENVSPFTSYAGWYSSLHVYFETSLELKFFINFLSEIVPYEPSIYLKVHINKVPSVPSGAHAYLSDYILLVKTRLHDLDETTDYIGLFGEHKTTEKEGRESDISKVVAHFEETGEILKTVIEASVFRRTYYQRVFLGDLLKNECDKENSRHKFIEKLYLIGKIPNAMYADWCCRNNLAHKKKEELMDTESDEFFI